MMLLSSALPSHAISHILPANYINDKVRISWLRLIRSTNVGVRTFYELLNIYGSADTALDNLDEMAKNGGHPTKIIIPRVREIEQELATYKKFNAQILLACQEEYSSILREIADPPPIISVKGNISLLKKETIAIVGARNASINGMNIAKKFASDLSDMGFAIVSGMAKGIDAAAHSASLKGGTIGVIAGGIDNIYPKENEELFHKVYQDGLLISEYKIAQKPLAQYFPQRNRIISGLSSAVIIVEAAKKSGTLITARFAAEQGRDVFAVPGCPFDLRSQGTNFLIKNGAFLAENAQDVIDGLFATKPRQSELFEDHDNSFKIYPKPRIPQHSELSRYRHKLLNCITFAPVEIEEISKQLDIEYSVINFMIVELELAGKISRLYGNKVCKIL